MTTKYPDLYRPLEFARDHGQCNLAQISRYIGGQRPFKYFNSIYPRFIMLVFLVVVQNISSFHTQSCTITGTSHFCFVRLLLFETREPMCLTGTFVNKCDESNDVRSIIISRKASNKRHILIPMILRGW